MSKKKRLIFILTLALLFAIISPLIAFYSLGWRLDFKTWKISQPGIFYFKVYPKSVEIKVDGKIKKTDFFFGTLMVENLVPKTYSVEVKKEGLQAWNKNLEIKKGEPTELKNIILFPSNPDFTEMFKGVKSFFLSQTGNRIIFEENSGLSLFDFSNGQKKTLITSKDLLKKTIKNADFSADENFALIKFSDNAYSLINFEDAKSISLASLSIKKAVFSGNSPYRLICLMNNNKLAEIDANTLKIVSQKAEKSVDFDVLNNSIYYLDNSGFVYKQNTVFDFKNKINREPVKLGSYSLKALPSYIILSGQNGIYAVSLEDGSIKTISQNQGIYSGTINIAYADNGQIKISYFKKQDSQPQKSIRDDVFLTRFSEKIDNIAWLNDYYLALSVGDDIKIVETDDRDKINIITLKIFKSPKMAWDWNNKILYVLSEGNLYSLKTLMP